MSEEREIKKQLPDGGSREPETMNPGSLNYFKQNKGIHLE